MAAADSDISEDDRGDRDDSDRPATAQEEGNDGEEMPWAAYNDLYAYAGPKDKKNFWAQCKLCLPKVTKKSCSNDSAGNLKSHLKVRSLLY